VHDFWALLLQKDVLTMVNFMFVEYCKKEEGISVFLKTTVVSKKKKPLPTINT